MLKIVKFLSGIRKLLKKNIYKFLNLISYLFFIYIVSKIDIENFLVFKQLITENYVDIFISLIFLLISNLIVGYVWSIYIKQHLSIDIKISFLHWLNSFKAKYVPGKITAPILRLSNEIYDGSRKILFFSIFLENIYLVFSNVFLGFYLFTSQFYSFKFHLFLYFLINCLIYVSLFFRFTKTSFKYFKNIFILQFANIFYFLSLYFITSSLETSDGFRLALLYQFVAGVSILFSIFPAGIGIREYGVIEISKILQLNPFSREFYVVFVRIFALIGDLIIIIIASFLSIKNKKINK